MRDISSAAFLKILTSVSRGTKATSHDADVPSRWSVQSVEGCGRKGEALIRFSVAFAAERWKARRTPPRRARRKPFLVGPPRRYYVQEDRQTGSARFWMDRELFQGRITPVSNVWRRSRDVVTSCVRCDEVCSARESYCRQVSVTSPVTAPEQ